MVELAGISDPARAKAIVQRSAFLEFRITDKTGALEKALPAMDRTLRGLGVKGDTGSGKPSAVEQLLGRDTAKAQPKDTARPRPTRPGQGGRHEGAAKDTGKAPSPTARGRTRAPVVGGVLNGLIKQAGAITGSATPGEYLVPETAFPRVDSLINIPAVARQLPRNLTLRWSAAPTSVGVESYRFLYVLDDRPIITGSNLEDASAQLDPLTNGPIVTFQLDRAGGRKFGDETGRHVGDFMAILLDGRVQGRPPVIQSRIGRNGQITLGNKSLQEAQDLALTLKAGALPIPLKIVEERQVGASLGSDSIRDGITAGHRRHRDGRADHAGVLPAERRAGRRGPGPLHPLHPGRPLDDRGHAHAPGPRRHRALGRHRGGRQRADLRANTGGAAARQDRAARRWTRASSTP